MTLFWGWGEKLGQRFHIRRVGQAPEFEADGRIFIEATRLSDGEAKQIDAGADLAMLSLARVTQNRRYVPSDAEFDPSGYNRVRDTIHKSMSRFAGAVKGQHEALVAVCADEMRKAYLCKDPVFLAECLGWLDASYSRDVQIAARALLERDDPKLRAEGED